MNVEHVMTRDPWTVGEETELDRAMLLMDERGLRHLPVVRGDELVGIVSNRDLLEATGWEPVAQRERSIGRSWRTIGQIMKTPVVRIRPDETVVTAALELGLRRIGAMPVVDRGRLVGIVSERDLLRAWIELCNRETAPGETDVPVQRVMTRELRTLPPRATLAEAVVLCRSKGVNHLPVVVGRELAGFLSDRDIRRALGRNLPGRTPISELMTSQVSTLTRDVTLYEAAHRMHDRRISGIPIISGSLERPGKELVGLVTLTDVLAHCLESLR